MSSKKWRLKRVKVQKKNDNNIIIFNIKIFLFIYLINIIIKQTLLYKQIYKK